MSRKIELAKMMLHSLMHEMSGDQKLVFLTDIFCLTEDIRYAISEGHPAEEEMQNDSAVVVQGSTEREADIDFPGEAGCHEVDGTINRQGI